MLQIAIQLPSSPQYLPGKGFLPPGKWEFFGKSLLEYNIRLALKFSAPKTTWILHQQPDEGVFEMVERFGVRELQTFHWLEKMAEIGSKALPEDILILLRSEFLLLNGEQTLKKAQYALQRTPAVHHVEPAFPLKSSTLHKLIHLQPAQKEGGDSQKLSSPSETLGIPCPAFEAHRLQSFHKLSKAHNQKRGFLWVSQNDIVNLLDPFDRLRALPIFQTLASPLVRV